MEFLVFCLQLLGMIAYAFMQALKETWLYLAIALGLLLSTKPWTYPSMKAWLRDLFE